MTRAQTLREMQSKRARGEKADPPFISAACQRNQHSRCTSKKCLCPHHFERE